jgi:hypothetical protein
MNSATTNPVVLKRGDKTVTVSSEGQPRGYTCIIATAEGVESRCVVTKAECRKHMAHLYHSGWR